MPGRSGRAVCGRGSPPSPGAASPARCQESRSRRARCQGNHRVGRLRASRGATAGRAAEGASGWPEVSRGCGRRGRRDEACGGRDVPRGRRALCGPGRGEEARGGGWQACARRREGGPCGGGGLRALAWSPAGSRQTRSADWSLGAGLGRCARTGTRTLALVPGGQVSPCFVAAG